MGTVLAFYTHPERSMIYPSPKKRNPRVRALHSTKHKLPCLTGCFGCRSTLRGLAISRPGHQIHSIDVGHFDGFLSWWVVGIYELTSKSCKIITKYSQIIMKSLTQHVSFQRAWRLDGLSLHSAIHRSICVGVHRDPFHSCFCFSRKEHLINVLNVSKCQNVPSLSFNHFFAENF